MNQPDPSRDLLALVRGHRLTDMVAAMVRLGLADQLASGPADAMTLAERTGSNAPTLYRLLRGLASAGLLVEERDRRFRLAPMGELLRSDVDASLEAWVRLIGRSYVRDAWANLEDAVRTGRNEFTVAHGENVWSWRRHEPAEDAIFNRAMAQLSRGVGEAIAEAYDFAPAGVVADVGGGSGTLIAAVLARHPHLRGILFDQPHVVAEAARVLEAAGVEGRVEVVGGDFFASVPGGADVYLMKAILHDWEDGESIRILEAIRRVIRADGRLVVVERVIGPPNGDLDGALSDLHMLLMPGGRERTAGEWSALYRSGGFEFVEARPVIHGWSLIVGRPA